MLIFNQSGTGKTVQNITVLRRRDTNFPRLPSAWQGRKSHVSNFWLVLNGLFQFWGFLDSYRANQRQHHNKQRNITNEILFCFFYLQNINI